MSGRSRPYDHTSLSKPSRNSHARNAFSLIAQREISPRTKHVPRRNWVDTSARKCPTSTRPRSDGHEDARYGLLSWVESESLRHLSANYCPLFPPPRSTIAAAFSPDGKVLASTHGDHTVKIIDCQTGNCLKVLVGHRRTPWVVRFHPLHPEIIASGSLDQEVRLWDVKTSECIISHQFYRPIASIAFHAKGDLLAVASGHKLYIWHYNKRGEASSPSFALKTRRSLRAVHFHPLAAPFLLTAEVNDLDSSDSTMAQATTLGYLQYPPPAVFVATVRASEYSASNDEALTSFPFFVMPPYSIDDLRVDAPSSSNIGSSDMQAESFASMQFQNDTNASEQYVDHMEIDEMPASEGSLHRNSANIDIPGAHTSTPDNSAVLGQFSQFLPSRDNIGWELPFLQGWLMGQTQAGAHSMLPNVAVNSRPVNSSTLAPNNLNSSSAEATMGTSAVPSGITIPGGTARPGQQIYLRHSHLSSLEPGPLAASTSISQDGSDVQTIVSRVQPELAASVTAAAAAELPCTVKLRVWKYEIKTPCAQLVADKCRLTIPHAVLCSEMGAHFSPCGRFLAACVACMYPHVEHDPGLQSSVFHDAGAATSPTRHPLTAHQVMYELRIYSLEEATFGSVLASRAIRAAHCLTSIQFSPTSEHILLAYGRRHGSLLKSIVIDGETTLPIYTVLEVYRLSDMELVRVLASAEDEVNVACFHPFAGGGLVYGTKEGKLRVLQYDRGLVICGQNHFPEENFLVSASE